MSDDTATAKTESIIVRGQAFNFMPIPMIEHNAEWFEAGPIAFAVEARVLGESQGNLATGGGTIHVFSADRSTEFVRFDCFDKEPHYHYLNHTDQINTVWGYDPNMNGPMLPGMLRMAGAGELADRVEREGFDKSVLGKLDGAMTTAHARTVEDRGMVEESEDWFRRWMAQNPQFKKLDA
jgi:hypothetical protein